MSLSTDIVTGKNVCVNGVSTLGYIVLDNRSDKSPIMASNLHGGTDRSCGIRMLKGSIFAYGDTPPVFPNDLFDMQFTMDGVTNHAVENTSVRCLAIEVVADAYEEKLENCVYYIIHFGGAGVDFTTLATPPTDVTQPAKYCTKSLGISLNGVPQSYTAGMHLKVEALADPDWNSSLNGIAFYPAGTIDWSMEYTQRVNTWPQPATEGSDIYPDLDSVCTVHMNTRLDASLQPTNYWDLAWGKLGRKGGKYDNQSRKALTATFTIEKCTNGTSIGWVKDPTTTTKWS